MIIRRYYPKGFKGKTYSDEYIEVLRKKGVAVDLIDTARTEVIFNKKEQKEMFNKCCEMVHSNTRWVLDNLDNLVEFKVNSQSYHRKNRKTYKGNITE